MNINQPQLPPIPAVSAVAIFCAVLRDRNRVSRFGFSARWLMIGLLAFAPLLAAASATNLVDFAHDIRPILNQHCVSCHGGVKRAGKISWIDRESVVATSANDEKPIHPGDPDRSEMIHRVTTDNPDDVMPPPSHGSKLSAAEVKLLREWIREGAPWKEHWAWLKPIAPAAPKISNPKWIRAPLDAFVLAKLDAEKIKPSAEAPRAQWLRRASFDLTGLAPTPEEVRAFAADRSPDAFAKAADRLLASPRFGEHWASPWLDAARYADSMGFEKDPLRTMWPYRDWVIRALNSDLPFDQFTVKQLAGDLLPDATLDDKIATAFHRQTQVNTEGGTDDEEFRVTATVDRVGTTWQVWQGVTMNCVQCHSHPYEPIRHEEFYRSLAFFNTTRDWNLREDFPVARVPLDSAAVSRANELDEKISRLRRADFAARAPLAKQTNLWTPLTPDAAKATRGNRLLIVTNEFGGADVTTTGTVAANSEFTIEIPLPLGFTNFAALRVDVPPENPAAACLTPEPGFAFTKFQIQWSAGSTNETNSFTALPLAHCFGDEAEPMFEDDATVLGGRGGWGAFPRLTHARHAVFATTNSVALPEGARLKIFVAHGLGGGDKAAQVVRRIRFSITERDDWARLMATEEFKARRSELAALKKEREGIASAALPVMREQDAALQRVTAVFERGNWLNKGEVETPGVPKLFGALPAGAPADRLAFARWLVSPENPLTARVTVNRVWEQLFGLGLVESVENFGSSGEKPVNQELLDHLALRFQNELGWSTKKLLREIVLSATYRQDSRTTKKLAARDPRNRLLARGPRLRLSAEMLRDHALAASGLLSEKMFGPPVMPPAPANLGKVIYNKDDAWKTSAGEDRHRRAVYTLVRRTTGYPSAITFDQPSRETCTVRRIRTNTPLQALVTLNDPVFVECAVALAGRMRREGGEELKKEISRGYELATGATPDSASVKALQALYKNALARYQKNPELAAQLSPQPTDAALALVANAILNLDAALTK